MAFTLPDLPYAHDALEPHIDAKTMEIHHGKHHGTYVSKLNDAVKGTEWENKDIAEICRQITKVPDNIRTAVRNNGGGHFNHSLFWQIMGPGGGGEPGGELAEAIKSTFGGLDQLKEQVNNAGVARFGSGWAWVCRSADGKLNVCHTPNQDNPLMEGLVDCVGTPILGVDVWEHAYYLKYQNRRPDYLAAWWNTVNWDQVAKNYANAK